MTNRIAPTHTALIRYEPAGSINIVTILDLRTGHVVDQLIVDDAEWLANGADHLNRRGFEPVDTTQVTGRYSTWPLVRV